MLSNISTDMEVRNYLYKGILVMVLLTVPDVNVIDHSSIMPINDTRTMVLGDVVITIILL